MISNVEIRTLPAHHVACVRHIGPYMECGKAWEVLLRELGAAGRLAGNPLRMGIGYDNPSTVPAAELRYDACVTVAADFVPTGAIGVRDIPAGEHAVITLRGPYNELAATYGTLFTWLATSGRQPANAPCYELYRNGPDTTPEADLVTEVCLPLRP